MVDDDGVISFGTSNRLAAAAIKVLVMVDLILKIPLGFRIRR